MDLRLMDATPTEEEREALDLFLGAPESGWEGGLRDERDAYTAEGGHEARAQRHLLLPALQAIQSRIGWISEGALNYVCQRLTVPPADAYGVATFYALLSTVPRPRRVLHVCDDVACRCKGAAELAEELERTAGPAHTHGPEGDHGERQRPVTAGDHSARRDDEESAARPGEHDAPRFLDAGVAPHLAVEPEDEVRRNVDHDDQRCKGPETAPETIRNRAFEAENERRQVRRQTRDDVESRERNVLPHEANDAVGQAALAHRAFGREQRRPPIPPPPVMRAAF